MTETTITKKTPQLRFPEFDDEWITFRIENLFKEFKSGKTITSSKIFEVGDYPVYGGNGIRGYTDTYTHIGYYLLIGRQGALCGNLNISHGKAYFSEHAIACKANEENYTKWFFYKLYIYNLNRLSESSAQPGLSVKKLLRFKLTIPSFPEQQKIANFLTQVDRKIELVDKQQAALEQYKKGVMQKLFNQEIRFKIKNEAGELVEPPEWEEKRIGEIFKVTRGDVLSTSKVSNVKDSTNKFPVYSSQSKHKGLLGYYNSYLFEKAITWTTDGANAGYVQLRNEKFYCTNVCGVLQSKEGFTNQFVSEYLNRITFKYVSYVGNPKLMNNIMSNIKIDFPCLDEQTKIANFLTAIDTKIEAITKRSRSHREWKKGLLQKMFV